MAAMLWPHPAVDRDPFNARYVTSTHTTAAPGYRTRRVWMIPTDMLIWAVQDG